MMIDHLVDYGAVAEQVAEAAASVCEYTSSTERWKTGRCDCKFIFAPYGVGWEMAATEQLGRGEHTGCCELRRAYWILNALVGRKQEVIDG